MKVFVSVVCFTALFWVGLLHPTHISSASAESRPPNIILIVADDLGYADLGCYGQQKIATPCLDQMAKEGLRFTQVYAGAPVCAPSRCVLMTGLHSGHAYIRENSPEVGGQRETYGNQGQRRLSLRKSDLTVAELLQSAGYRTGLAGKWGLAEPDTDGTPRNKGFEESLGYLNQNHAVDYYTDLLWRNDEPFQVKTNRQNQRLTYSHDLFTDFALDFVKRHRERSFFLYLAFTVPHEKWEVPDQGAYATKDWPENAKNYAAMVSRLDSDVGRLLDQLKESGIDDNTIVLFTSDNGEAPREPDWETLFDSSGNLRGKKGSVYEGGIRVPMVVRWPGVVPTGKVSDAVWSFADFLPTAAELVGLPVVPAIDGRSVWPIIAGHRASTEPRYLYWERPDSKQFQQAARFGKWKAVRQGWGQPLELYDLEADPAETSNQASSEKPVIESFEAYFASARTDSPHWPTQDARRRRRSKTQE